MKKISRRQFFKIAGWTGALGLIASYPFFIERYIVQTNICRIPVPNLPEEFTGLRIVHLTDLHYGFLVPQFFIKGIIDKGNDIDCDMIVCTGDYVHEFKSTRQIDAVWPLMKKLKAPLGVYSVLGNHDHWADTARSEYWLKKSGQDLHHKVVPIERNGSKLWLAGAGDFWEDDRGIAALLRDVPESDCKIVLAHNPDTADTNFATRVDLFISGHTHGGQVEIPFVGTPILPVQNKNYSSGLKKSLRGINVFISRGIGWAILPIRFNCFPEIAVLELVPG